MWLLDLLRAHVPTSDTLRWQAVATAPTFSRNSVPVVAAPAFTALVSMAAPPVLWIAMGLPYTIVSGTALRRHRVCRPERATP